MDLNFAEAHWQGRLAANEQSVLALPYVRSRETRRSVLGEHLDQRPASFRGMRSR